MTAFKGMRWFKCDFQVQTPEDNVHWADDETRLHDPRRIYISEKTDSGVVAAAGKYDESKIQEIARKYLRRCHEVELDAIGVTDHNFSQKIEPREWFLTHLVEQNKAVAAEVGRDPLVIFPGFEVDIGYHVICLLAPAKKMAHIWRLNKLLCKLGLGENERFSGGPVPLRRRNAYVSLSELIDIVQKEFHGIVIAAHADQHDGIFENARNCGDYSIEGLLAVEVTSNPPAKRVLDILEGRNRDWQRSTKSPAFIMSSDAKSLRFDKERRPVANSIGYRSTWFKMSAPSIEALKQAFLDPSSRISLGERCPKDELLHPRIISLQIRGAAFLADQVINFSECLNCIIGGRGSGKSSLMEYLRFALSSEEFITEETNSLYKKRQALKNSLIGPSAEIRVVFQTDHGLTDTLIYRPSAAPGERLTIEGREVSDIKVVIRQLRAQFFSQGELSILTNSDGGQAQILEIIDMACGQPLADLQKIERNLQNRLTTLFQAAQQRGRLLEEINKIAQQEAELTRQLSARQAVSGVAAANQLGVKSTNYIAAQRESTKLTLDLSQALLLELNKPSLALPSESHNWPAAGCLFEIEREITKARTMLTDSVRQAISQYERAIEAIFGGESLVAAREKIEESRNLFLASCAERGIKPEDIAQIDELEALRRQLGQQLIQLQDEMLKVNEMAGELPRALAELHRNWRRQFKVREETAAKIQESIPSQAIKIKLQFMQDKASFIRDWKRLQPRDGRGRLARNWIELGDDVFHSWINSTDASPWETVERGRTDPRAILYFTGGPLGHDLQPNLISYIDTPDVTPIWESLRVTRIRDLIDVELLREDGSTAGTIKGNLSEGQRNTVLLNLILARGNGPVIIDQPEDELDSSFIFKTLVRDLRKLKMRRQLIVVTHNANLPVNSDAELIYALEARGGKGQCICEGGLDGTLIARAVLDIMEGSEQAFKLRQEKYHF